MATIQIREIPENAYEVIRRRARAAGKSIQNYMRDQVIELAAHPTAAETWDTVETILSSLEAPGPTHEEIMHEIRSIRDA